MTATDRDICIEQLADAEAALLDHVADVTTERDAYRVLAQQAVHLLNAKHHELLRVRAQNRMLLEEGRALRNASVDADRSAA